MICSRSSRARCRCDSLGHERVDSLNILHHETEQMPQRAEDVLTPIQRASDRGRVEFASFLPSGAHREGNNTSGAKDTYRTPAYYTPGVLIWPLLYHYEVEE